MDGPITIGIRSQLPVWVFAAAAVLALVLPTVGMALDHHYAERMPGHTHVYIGDAQPNHHHNYEAAHLHGQSTVVADSAGLVWVSTAAGEVHSTKIVVMDRVVGDDESDRPRDMAFAVLTNEIAPSQLLIAPDPYPPRV